MAAVVLINYSLAFITLGFFCGIAKVFGSKCIVICSMRLRTVVRRGHIFICEKDPLPRIQSVPEGVSSS